MKQNVIQNDFDTMGVLLVQREDSIEFIVPVLHHSNIRFYPGLPVLRISSEGKFDNNSEHYGIPTFFYIPKVIFDQIQNLFAEFKIYKSLHETLILAFISMFLTRCWAPYRDSVSKKYAAGSRELSSLINLFEDIRNGKTEITKFNLEYRNFEEGLNANRNRNIGPTYFKKITNAQSILFLEEIIKNYKQNLENDHILENGELALKSSNKSLFSSSKNHLKYSQNYYAHSLYYYLNDYIYSETNQYDTASEEFSLLMKELSRFYKTNRKLLFIGKLMILSGLITVKNYQNDTNIIDHLKKQLKNTLKQEKLRNESFKKLLKTDINNLPISDLGKNAPSK